MSCLMLTELPLSEQIAYELHHASVLAARAAATLNSLDPSVNAPLPSPGGASGFPWPADGSNPFLQKQALA